MAASRKKTITATDVAKRAGVSQTTVSRVFNPESRQQVKEKTQELVRQAARELGYYPNAIAQTMASGFSHIIGIVVPDSYNIFHYSVLQLLISSLRKLGLKTMVFTTEPSDDVEDLLRRISQYQIDGVIVTSAVLGQRAAGSWNKAEMPVILFNSDIPDADVSVVQSDHYQSGFQMAEYLLSAGYQHFAFVTAEQSPHLNLLSRQQGFVSGLAVHGVLDCRIIPAAYSYQSGLAAGRLLLEEKTIPDAVFCSGDINGFGVIDAIRRYSSLRLGADIGVAGFDAPVIDQFQGYDMTAVSQPVTELASDAAELMLRMIMDPSCPQQKIIHPVSIIARSSTRAYG